MACHLHPRRCPSTCVPARSLQRPRAGGLSPTTLEGKRFRSLLHGVYMLADQPLTLPIWVDAARLVLPDDAIVHHLTGLHARGVWVGAPWPLRFASSTDRQVRHRVVRMARLQRLPACDGGVAAAGACFAAACAELDLVDAVAAGDWLLHLGRCSYDDLRRAVAAHRGTGAPAARRAVRLVRGGAESSRETLVRLMLALAGLPEPRCNLGVGTAGALIGRGDLVYVEFGLVVEYDGRQHADSAVQWEHDLDRLDDFTASRWRHVRVTAVRLRRPRDVVLRVYEALVAGGYTGPAPTFGPVWVDLFERRTAARRAAQSPRADSWSRPPAAAHGQQCARTRHRRSRA